MDKGKILEITEMGNPVLRERAAEIADVKDPGLQEFIDDLIATCADANGVGIAAPQVDVPKRIFIISSRPNARYPNAPVMEPTAVINPEIISRSEETLKDWEGCLSIPGIRGLVPRHTWVDVRYISRDGGVEERRFSDFIARIFQHELDHLDGVLFLDRVLSNRDLLTEKEYVKLMRRESE
ncbi:MAG TPA: peptide deformylase [Thermodesulfobacteriota bacterium]|nr:peptide deformylase [Thermodesulfobacteriota bacterium]